MSAAMFPARMLPVTPDHTGQPSEVPDEFGAPLDVTPDPVQMAELRPKVIAALQQVYDPEIPVNIYELGLIYDVLVDTAGKVGIRMTLTAPACPAAQTLPGEVRDKARGVDGVSGAQVEITFDPPWSMERMTDAARLQLGLL
jgi:FeS assembly SUF system protein